MELGLSQSKETNGSVPAHEHTRLETVNLQYESFDGPQHVKAEEYIIPALNMDGSQFSNENNGAVVTAKNDPAIEANSAYCSSGDPPLSDDPAYI